MSKASDDQLFQVLALDGGGAKALFTAQVLAHLEADLDVNIADSFDLIAGTSAGGIIALALGAGVRPAEIVEHYKQLVKDVFPRARQRKWKQPRRVVRPAYDANVLRTALRDVLGDRLLGDSGKRLVIPSWDVHGGGVHIFKTPHHEHLSRDWKIPMVDVALATSAAPTYFPAAHVGDFRLIDGGIWANNPSVVAIAEAVSMLDVPLSRIKVLNIGTTHTTLHQGRRLDNGGLASWAFKVIPMVMAANSLGNEGSAMHLVGKDKFHRFDENVPDGMYKLDKADSADLSAHAARLSRQLSPTFRTNFANHVAAPYAPVYGTGSMK